MSISLGERVRALRRERELSQRGLAQGSGLSPNAISLIERDEISPSVATLQRLAAALQVKMSYFFEDAPSETHVVYARCGDRPAITGAEIAIEGIGARLIGQQMEPFFIRLGPEVDGCEDPVVHDGHELVCCVQGRVEYQVDGHPYSLETGDLLLFEANLPHCWRNLAKQPSCVLLVIDAPAHQSDSVRRHFPDHPSITHLE